MNTGQVRESERLVALDLLRGLAAFAVMIPHYLMYRLGAAGTLPEAISIASVEVFFVLSGFVLGPQIVLCATRCDLTSLRTFLVRRWMRTVPSYFVALMAISILFRETATADFFRYTAYVQNLFTQSNSTDYYPVAWSLSVEEWYYVVFSIVLLGSRFGLKHRATWWHLVVTTLLFIAAITLGRLLFGPMNDWGAAVRRVVVFRIDAIAYGFLLYLCVSRVHFDWTWTMRCAALVALLATASAMLALNVTMLAGGASPLFRYVHPFISAAFGISTVMFFLSIDASIQSVRSASVNAACAYLGQISYPIYLFHLVVLFGLADAMPKTAQAVNFPFYLIATVLLATAFHYAFERSILAARPRYLPTAAFNAHTALPEPGE
jgi:peptidoglycan/LPS O-acetylase OafA/YrhL